MSQFFSTPWTRVSAVAAITLLLGACGKGQQAAAPQTPAATGKSAAPAVAVINGDSISRDEFDTYLKALLRGKPIGDVTPEEKNQVLDQMINMDLLAENADKDGLAKDPDVTNRLALARLQILADAGAQKYIKDHQPTDQELHAQYDAVPDKTEYHAAHILVGSKDKAESIIKKLKGGANFADLAKAESSDNSKNQGGDLGWFTTSKMVKPFGDAVKGLKKGEITPEPVQTQFGWHIIKLEDTRDAAFEEMKPQLSNAVLQKNFQAHIEDLKKAAKIEKNL
ncbi:MAG TPA: peptidylprolyl isomerase [Steroidobacteraceae bacterium]|jgi:peptidyl-prolyl cis-trans isomerase C|nr:peptidylprolyl isomerase [Steroidobacteraceae bacterium]